MAKKTKTKPAAFPALTPVALSPEDDPQSVQNLARDLVNRARPALEGLDLATRAALAALPSVVSNGGAHQPPYHLVKRALDIGEAFADAVRAKQGAEVAK